MIDEHISHYHVLERLGRGGMGIVYRAVDTKLARQVALKFLPDGIRDAPEVLDRFAREARSAAALNHPNICTVYEIGEQDGRPFIAMELLEGRTLADAIGGRPMPIGLSIDVAMQIASALDAAHTKGIIHRDIKPANIFLTSSGAAKVLDFGLAKSTAAAAQGSPDSATIADSANLTGTGSTLGTIAYMSPEQARGQDLDGRSDLFSLGLVLYEMVTGRRAFDGETTAVVFDGILNRIPAAPSELNPDVPAGLELVIAKAIQKDRASRYQSAADFGADLRALRRTTDSGRAAAFTPPTASGSGPVWPSASAQPAAPVNVAQTPGSHSSRWRRIVPAAAILLAAAIGFAAWQFGNADPTLTSTDVILIADFDNTTGDSVFDGTLKQALAVKLEESPFLNVLSEQRVRETLGFMSRPADSALTPAVAREVCQRQGIKAVMLGSIASLGSTYVLTLGAEDCTTGDVLAREQATAPNKEQVLAALGTAASNMRGKLGESLASITRTDKPIEQATTSSLDALKAFSLGWQKRTTSTDQEALPFFRRAIELDPQFALAHAQLGTIYSNLGERSRSTEHRQRAYELRERVSRRERLYIEAHYYSGVANDPDKALATYDVWKQEYPRDYVPHVNSGILYSGRQEQQRALDSYLTALEIDPRALQAFRNAFGKLVQLDRLDEAKKLVDDRVGLVGETPETTMRLYELAARRYDRAMTDAYAAKIENTPLEMDWLGMRAAEMAYYGQTREAARLMERHVALLKRQGLSEQIPVVRSGQAVTMAFYGQMDAAREHLKAAEATESSHIDCWANLAFTYAALGDAAAARMYIGKIRGNIPDAIFGQLENTLEASLALEMGRPQDAVKRFEDIPADPSGLRVNALCLRADAFRALKRLDEAERDYRAAIEARAGGPFNLSIRLAQIGLARTLAAAGKTAEARSEYQKFLDDWEQADQDLHLLKELRAELAKLGS